MLPLELHSPSWDLLEEAYGTAGEVPHLLTQLEGGNVEALNELFGRICHQMSVYSSSIAAFPHLVTIASKLEANPHLQSETLCLAGAICESREFEQELHRSQFAGALETALPVAIDLTEEAINKATDPISAIYLLKSIAAFNRRQALARVLEGFSDEEFTLECPSCSTELYVWPCSEGLFVASEDPVTHKQTKRVFVSPDLQGRSKSQGESLWLEQQSSKAASLAGVRSKLPFLFGEAICPKCRQSFPLFKELLKQAT